MTLYIPPAFRVGDEAVLAAFIDRHAFGTLVAQGADGPVVSHIPFVVERAGDGRTRLLGHVARANPQWRAFENGAPVLAIFHGPHAYVSPTWYAQHPAVPTWNYAVVHAHGSARLMDEAALLGLLERLSSRYEAHRPAPWRLAEAPAEFIAGLARVIVGFSIEVERLEGKFKLSQNRPAEVERVIDALDREGEAALADFMRAHRMPPKG